MKHIHNIAEAFRQLAEPQIETRTCKWCGEDKAFPIEFEGHGSLVCKACSVKDDELFWRE